jgi:hypothetical protein
MKLICSNPIFQKSDFDKYSGIFNSVLKETFNLNFPNNDDLLNYDKTTLYKYWEIKEILLYINYFNLFDINFVYKKFSKYPHAIHTYIAEYGSLDDIKKYHFLLTGTSFDLYSTKITLDFIEDNQSLNWNYKQLIHNGHLFYDYFIWSYEYDRFEIQVEKVKDKYPNIYNNIKNHIPYKFNNLPYGTPVNPYDEKIITNETHKVWELSNHPDITLDILNRHPNLDWQFDDIIENLIKTYGSRFNVISEFVKLKNNILLIFISHLITINDLLIFPHENWDWAVLSKCIKPNDISTNINLPWDWNSISKNYYLTIDFIEKHITKPLNWGYISSNNNITLDDIQKYPHFPWSYFYLSMNENLTVKFESKISTSNSLFVKNL